MLKTLCAALALCLPLAPAIAADWEGVFEGTLGKAHIIALLDAGPDVSSFKGCCSDGSRYSYLPRAYDLKLALEKEGRTLEFTEASVPHFLIKDLADDDPKRTGHWSIMVDDDGARGTWSSVDGKKTLPIVLKRLPLKDMGREGNALVNNYNQRWIKEVKISGATDPVHFGKVAMAFEKDSAFQLPMPVFTVMPDKAVMAKANRALRDYYKQSLMQNRECINSLWSETQIPKEPEFNFTVPYASPRVVSIMESGSVFCGGAHPNNYVSFVSFDLVTGEQMGGRYQLDLTPKGFGRLLKLDSREERIAFENFALGRWHEAAKKAGEEGDASCAEEGFMADQAPGEKEFSLSFAKTGLAVQRFDYPSVAANCLFQDFNPTIIPWADLRPFLRPDQKLLPTELQ